MEVCKVTCASRFFLSGKAQSEGRKWGVRSVVVGFGVFGVPQLFGRQRGAELRAEEIFGFSWQFLLLKWAYWEASTPATLALWILLCAVMDFLFFGGRFSVAFTVPTAEKHTENSGKIRWKHSIFRYVFRCVLRWTTSCLEIGTVRAESVLQERPLNNFQSRGPQIPIFKGFGTSGRKIGAPQKRQIQFDNHDGSDPPFAALWQKAWNNLKKILRGHFWVKYRARTSPRTKCCDSAHQQER